MVPVELVRMPSAVVFWIVPPEPLLVLPLLSPVTVKLPVPVVLRRIPLVPPLDEIFWNVTPLAPIVVLAMLRAVVVIADVLPMLFVPVTLTTPPLVAVKAVLPPALS